MSSLPCLLRPAQTMLHRPGLSVTAGRVTCCPGHRSNPVLGRAHLQVGPAQGRLEVLPVHIGTHASVSGDLKRPISLLVPAPVVEVCKAGRGRVWQGSSHMRRACGQWVGQAPHSSKTASSGA